MFSYKGSFIIEYKFKALTGLRIGGSKEAFEIGGIDNCVIKTEVEIPEFYQVNGEKKNLPKGVPYIPGSSIKGKMRSLLEWVKGRVEEKIKEYSDNIDKAGGVCECGKCEICKVFGTGDANTLKKLKLEKQPGPPRLKVFDAYPTWDTLKRLQDALGEGIFTEIKTENQINRITSRANPRKIERVPAGAEFEGEMIFDVYKKDEDKDLIKIVFEGMKRLEDNYLGGYGSRGSGKIEFTEVTIKWRDKKYYETAGKEGEILIVEKEPLEEAQKKLIEKISEIFK